MQQTVSEARLESILNTAVDGIIAIDEKGHILLFNKACEAMFGYASHDVVGQNVKILMPSDYRQNHDNYLHSYHKTGQRKIIGIGREVRGQHKDGTIFPLELSVGETKTSEGRQYIGVLRDITSRVNVEERMHQLQADLMHLSRVSALDEMGATIAHELNQPLTALTLYLQAALKTMTKPDAQMADHDVIVPIIEKSLQEAERTGNIIRHMRNFIEKRDPERRPISLRSLIEEAVELTFMGFGAKNITIEISHHDDEGEALNHDVIHADPVQIQQILVNILRNAIDVIRDQDKPFIKVKLNNDGNIMRVAIQDSGNGIPADKVPNLFKAFSTTKKNGMGLGLAISKSIAQNHSGDLKVDPGGNGEGACFILEIPIHYDN